MAVASLSLVALGAGAAPALAGPMAQANSTNAGAGSGVDIDAGAPASVDQRPHSGVALIGASMLFLAVGTGSVVAAQRRRWNTLDLREADSEGNRVSP